ncbi:MAG: hypothetical protein EOO06_19220 [Chitinophagaceae bacterium]|nr:MAG: hypothetical protein EOO06_19220 [Chitinophagaceae bacterium]
MKALRFIAFFAFCLITHSALAQLENTRWVGSFHIPGEAECVFHFKKDSLNMFLADRDIVVEQMSYKLSGDTLTLKKLAGSSPCDGETPGLYRWKVDGDFLRLRLISDNCSERAGAGLEDIDMNRVIEPGRLKKD